MLWGTPTFTYRQVVLLSRDFLGMNTRSLCMVCSWQLCRVNLVSRQLYLGRPHPLAPSHIIYLSSNQSWPLNPVQHWNLQDSVLLSWPHLNHSFEMYLNYLWPVSFLFSILNFLQGTPIGAAAVSGVLMISNIPCLWKWEMSGKRLCPQIKHTCIHTHVSIMAF